jgi:hypothetical protein
MSLLFTDASTNRVSHGTGLGNWTAASYAFWYYPITLTAGRNILNMFTGSFVVPSIAVGSVGTDELRMTWRRGGGGSNMIYETNNADITANKWWFVGVTVDQAAGAGVKVVFYLGDLNTLATARTNGTTTDVSSGYASNNGQTFYVGDNGTDSTAHAMRMGTLLFFPSAVLTQADFQRLQFRPLPLPSSVRLFTHYGFNGTGTQPNWTGNGHSGTVTGATVAAHVPLGPIFGFDQHLDFSTAGLTAEKFPLYGRQMSPYPRPWEVVGY